MKEKDLPTTSQPQTLMLPRAMIARHDTTGSPSTTHVKGPRDGREQIPTAFREIDRRRCQDATPVRDRPHTRVVE